MGKTIDELVAELKNLTDREFETKFSEVLEEVKKDDRNIEYNLNEIFKKLTKEEDKKRFLERIEHTNRNDRSIRTIEMNKMSDLKAYKDSMTMSGSPAPTPVPTPTTTHTPSPGSGRRIPVSNPFGHFKDLKDKIKAKTKKTEVAEELLYLEEDGPAIKEYKEATDELKQLLEKVTKEKDILKNYIEKINKATDVAELDAIKAEIAKPEKNYSEQLKNGLEIIINNRKDQINFITSLPNAKYEDLQREIARLEGIAARTPAEEADLTKYKEQKKEYERLDAIVKEYLNGTTTIDKAIIEAQINASILTPAQRDELVKDKLNAKLETEISYDGLLTTYDDDIIDLDNEITEREKHERNYRSIISIIKKLIANPTADLTTNAKKINDKTQKLPDELKPEMLGFIKKFVVNDPRITLNADSFPDLKTALGKIKGGDISDLEIGTKRGGVPLKAAAYEAYKAETKNKITQKKELEKNKADYDLLIDKIKNTTDVSALDAVEAEINSFVDEPAYFKTALKTAFDDKKKKLTGATTTFDEVGKEYRELEKEMNKGTTTKERKDEIKKYLENYKKLIDAIKYFKSKGFLEAQAIGLIDNALTANNITPELARELKTKVTELYNPKFSNRLSPDEIMKSFDQQIADLESQINSRETVAQNYKDIIEALKDLKTKLDSGMDKDSEEIKNQRDLIKAEIDKIDDAKLKDELGKILDAVLNRRKIKDPKPRKDLLGKVLSFMTGLTLGGVAGFLITNPIVLGLTGLGIMGAKIATKLGIKKIKEKQEILGLETPSPELKEKIEKLKKSENFLNNVSIGLTGATIGLFVGQIAHGLTASAEPTGPTNTTEPGNALDPSNPDLHSQMRLDPGTPPPQTPSLKVGDSASGLDLTYGHDSASWAINGTNAEHLNQAIMHDGNSVIGSIMDAQGNTYSSLAEATSAGKTLSELSVNVVRDGDLAPRAFVNVGKALR